MKNKSPQLICMVAVVILLGSVSTRAQEHLEATFEPVRFVDESGDPFYFGYVQGWSLILWRDRWLLMIADGHDCYLADTQTLTISKIGREGRGPGEYVSASGISVRGDTVMITHEGFNTSHFLLPSGRFLWRDPPKEELFPHDQLWISDDVFLSADIPRSRREEGLFGRFSRNGELLQAFGEYDLAERFESNEMARQYVNSGSLALTPDGNIAFIYDYMAVLSVYSPQGGLIRTNKLEMPWNDRNYSNPVKNPRGPEWSGRSLVASMQIVQDGFLLACRGFRRREGIMRNFVVTYSWDGRLVRVIHLPMHEDPELRPDMLSGVIQVKDELWVTLQEDPIIRKLIIKQDLLPD